MKSIIAALVIAAAFTVYAGPLFAEEGKFELTESYGMKDLLTSFAGKRVSVKIDGGGPWRAR